MIRVFFIRSTIAGLLLAGIACASAPAWSDAAGAATAVASSREAGLPLADKVLVRKAERRLYLLHKNDVLRSYPIQLGLAPMGQKEQEGDFRTPEGRYRLVRRNANSDYFLSLQVSYPNDQDLARARVLGVPPGGAIMIHGLPNVPKKTLDYYEKVDWTDGCIAVSNADMVEIWLMTPLDTPIEITP
ncbi:MAG TPA: L,D-transpeptidase family protein [Steroidobacteraceae bacterium]|nr:L,D-transpeptidase family protein [Steroidobacteraceae bacterium]